MFNSTPNGISTLQNTLDTCRTVISGLPRSGWHLKWRKALRWARCKLPSVPQEVVELVTQDLQEAWTIPTNTLVPDEEVPSPPIVVANTSRGTWKPSRPNPIPVIKETNHGDYCTNSDDNPDSSLVTSPTQKQPGSQAGTSVTPPRTNNPPQDPTSLHSLKKIHLQDSYLVPTQRILILGDNNILSLPLTSNPPIQIDAFPDTKISGASRILLKGTPISPQVQKVILSFGLDDRRQSNMAILGGYLRKLLSAARKTFPNSEIYIPVINFSNKLPNQIKNNIKALNHLIRMTPRPIPRLPRPQFLTDESNIKWTQDTAALIWQHWRDYIHIQEIRPHLIEEYNQITNLSSLNLTPDQISLLSKGLSFIPSCGALQDVRPALAYDVQQYHRRLKLLAHFGPSSNPIDNRLPFVPPSRWEPHSEAIPLELTTLIQDDKRDISYLRVDPEIPNLTKKEEMALQQLRQNNSIVIKPADKGGRVVIMDRTDYLQEGYRQLQDTNYYSKLTLPIYQATKEQITTILNTLRESRFINHKQMIYLQGDPQPRPRRFYLLPKIHKSPESWPTPYKIPPGRPIVSDCGSESYQIAEFIDYFLNPLSTKHRSYLKDTNHFIETVKSIKLQSPCFLFSMDVESLYTNIDTSIGMKVVEEFLQKYPDPKRPDTQLLQLLHISLTRNDFQFNGDFFLQRRGTAMGKKFAPAYANIYMAHWEESVFPKCPLKPAQYLRYLDDIWGIWTHSREEFDSFLAVLNSHHPTIKLQAVLDDTSIDFLDTTTFKGPKFSQTGRLDLRVYVKPTDTHALLHKGSFHPTHTFRGILKSQILRFRRICTRTSDYRLAEIKLFRALKLRGYSWSLMRRIRHTTLHKPKDKRDTHTVSQSPIPIVTTYSTYTKRATHQLKTNFNRLLTNLTPFQRFRPISAFKKNPNLQDLLVRATLPPMTARTGRHKRRQIIRTTWGGIHIIPRRYPLNTSNCIYLLRCNLCQILYVGETCNSLRTRLASHRYKIRKHDKYHTHLTSHFQRHGLTNFHATILEHNPNWSTQQRRGRERVWIRQLDTRFPKGLNDRIREN